MIMVVIMEGFRQPPAEQTADKAPPVKVAAVSQKLFCGSPYTMVGAVTGYAAYVGEAA